MRACGWCERTAREADCLVEPRERREKREERREKRARASERARESARGARRARDQTGGERACACVPEKECVRAVEGEEAISHMHAWSDVNGGTVDSILGVRSIASLAYGRQHPWRTVDSILGVRSTASLAYVRQHPWRTVDSILGNHRRWRQYRWRRHRWRRDRWRRHRWRWLSTATGASNDGGPMVVMSSITWGFSHARSNGWWVLKRCVLLGRAPT